MGYIQNIENELIEINPTLFQEICDLIIYHTYPDKKYIIRKGTQSGKMKPTVGTPDTLVQIDNGKFVFGEHTTISSNRMKKLSEDIDKCLEKAKELNIEHNQIESIRLFTNFNLEADEKIELDKLVPEPISLQIETLDGLSLLISREFQFIAEEYFNIPISTGQVVVLSKFIEDYDAFYGKIATGLSNNYLDRNNYIESLNHSIENYEITILSGNQGVGKTKLAVEFLKSIKDYQVVCISNKPGLRIYYELNSIVKKTEPFLIFVDDANREESLKIILSFFKSNHLKQSKLLMTSRSYAISDITSKLQYYSTNILEISEPTKFEIDKVLESDPFIFSDRKIREKIQRISGGNFRIAIMCARLHIEKNEFIPIDNVLAVFKSYFENFALDNINIQKPKYQKVLTLLSFFNVLYIGNETFLKEQLDLIEMEFSEFLETIDFLDTVEIISTFKKEAVRGPEQNLAMYFFYSNLLENEVINFKKLFQTYFYRHSNRAYDLVRGTLKIMGWERINSLIKPKLENLYLDSERDYEKSKILENFWYFLPEILLDYVERHISSIPIKVEAELELSEDQVLEDAKSIASIYLTPYQYSNQILDLLGNLLDQNIYIKEVSDLAFKYVARHAEASDYLIKIIREKISYKVENSEFQTIKQVEFLLKFEIYLKSHPEIFSYIFQKSYFHFLSYSHYDINHKPEKLIEISDKVEASVSHSDIRNTVWELFENIMEVQKYYDSKAIIKCLSVYKNNPKYYLNDVSYLSRICSEKFQHSCFYNSMFLDELVNIFGIDRTKKIKEIFSQNLSPIYSLYKSLLEIRNDRSFLRTSVEKWRTNNYENLVKVLKTDSLEQFISHYEYIHELYTLEILNPVNQYLDILCDEFCKEDTKNISSVVDFILETKNESEYIPFNFLKTIVNDAAASTKFIDQLNTTTFRRKTNWILQYFTFKNTIEGTINHEHLVNSLKSSEEPFEFIVEHYSNLSKNHDLLNEIIKLQLDHYTNNKLSFLMYPKDQGKINLDKLSFNYLCSSFLIQLKYYDLFDSYGMITKYILNTSPQFILNIIIDYFIPKKFQVSTPTDNYRILSNIWQCERQDEEALITCLEIFMFKDQGFSFSNNRVNDILFFNLDEQSGLKAFEFLKVVVERFIVIPEYINLVLDVINSSLTQYKKEMVKHILSFTRDEKIFKSFDWITRSRIISGDQTAEDLDIVEWEEIETAISELPQNYKYALIKSYVRGEIQSCIQKKKDELRHRFIYNY